MKTKTNKMPAPNPEECGNVIKTKIEIHVNMAKQIVNLKELGSYVVTQYLRFCVGRSYEIPDDEDAKDVLETLIQERKEAVLKHIVNKENKTRAGIVSGQVRANNKGTNGGLVETGIGKATETFRKALNSDPDAFFDYGHDAVAICRAVSSDTHSDGCWRKLIRAKGEDAVRSAARDCWSNWRHGEEPANKGAALNAAISAMPDVANGGKEVR